MNNSVKFDYNDIVIVPKVQTIISSRSECDPYTYWTFKTPLCSEITIQKLPIFAAPMDTVVSGNNFWEYINNRITPCLPRGQYINASSTEQFFQSFGIHEIEEDLLYFNSNNRIYQEGGRPKFYEYKNIVIDTANGHMKKIVDILKKIKQRHPHINVMVGNIANPETFKILGEAGADYVRCSIGTGAGCTTAANVGVNYPLGSLITECRIIKNENSSLDNVKIVADGGIRNYSDAIKALALGADYIMIGSIFNKAIESAGFNYLFGVRISDKLARLLWRYDFPIKKKYRGMSTKAVQRSWGKSKLVTAEGITKYQKVEYTLNQWTENFVDYLKSDMSYSNAKTLDDFIGEADYCFITQKAYERFNK